MSLLDREPALVCSNYTVLETFALVQNRLGMDAVGALNDEFLPALTIEWVTLDDHAAAVRALLGANRRQLSLVDCTSFEMMRRLRIQRVFTLDAHFAKHGFECEPV